MPAYTVKKKKKKKKRGGHLIYHEHQQTNTSWKHTIFQQNLQENFYFLLQFNLYE